MKILSSHFFLSRPSTARQNLIVRSESTWVFIWTRKFQEGGSKFEALPIHCRKAKFYTPKRLEIDTGTYVGDTNYS